MLILRSTLGLGLNLLCETTILRHQLICLVTLNVQVIRSLIAANHDRTRSNSLDALFLVIGALRPFLCLHQLLLDRAARVIWLLFLSPLLRRYETCGLFDLAEGRIAKSECKLDNELILSQSLVRHMKVD